MKGIRVRRVEGSIYGREGKRYGWLDQNLTVHKSAVIKKTSYRVIVAPLNLLFL